MHPSGSTSSAPIPTLHNLQDQLPVRIFPEHSGKPPPEASKSCRNAPNKKQEPRQSVVVAVATAKMNPYKERKKSKSVDVHVRQQLEIEFGHQHKPTQVKITELASKLGVTKDFVRVWFSNRRQKQKRLKSASSKAGSIIPSSSYDITMETDSSSQEQDDSAVVIISATD